MSILDALRGMLSKKSAPAKGDSQRVRDGNERFLELSARFHASNDPAEKSAIWAQLCKTLPDSLFLAPFCYDDEDPNASIHDRELHATDGAKRLYAVNQPVINRGNPGIRLASKDKKRNMRMRTIIFNKTKEVWIPLFTDFSHLTPVFGRTSRITLITYAEARKLAKPYHGVIINPGPQAIRLGSKDTKELEE